MITLLIFLILSIVEFIIIFLKWNSILDAHELGKAATSAFGFHEKYNNLVDKVVYYLIKMKPILWLMIIFISLVNLFVAGFLSMIIHLIMYLIN